MIGRTLAANLSASAVTASTALLRAAWSLRLPRATPRTFAAARACRVRVLINAADAHSGRWRFSGSDPRLKQAARPTDTPADQKRRRVYTTWTLLGHREDFTAMELTSYVSRLTTPVGVANPSMVRIRFSSHHPYSAVQSSNFRLRPRSWAQCWAILGLN
jgi:hypothetical protein